MEQREYKIKKTVHLAKNYRENDKSAICGHNHFVDDINIHVIIRLTEYMINGLKYLIWYLFCYKKIQISIIKLIITKC